MMLASTLFESGYCSAYPLSPKVRGNFCQLATINASALKGDWPSSSSCQAASRIFSGTVHSAMVLFTLFPHPVVQTLEVSETSEVCTRMYGRRNYGWFPCKI